MAQILSLDGVSQGRTWKEAGTPGLYKGCAIGKSVSTFFCKMVCRIGKKAKEPTVNHLMTSKCLHFLGSSLRTMRMISSLCVGEHTDRAAFSWLTPQTPGLMSQVPSRVPRTQLPQPAPADFWGVQTGCWWASLQAGGCTVDGPTNSSCWFGKTYLRCPSSAMRVMSCVLKWQGSRAAEK